jgi:hypothetical protein
VTAEEPEESPGPDVLTCCLVLPARTSQDELDRGVAEAAKIGDVVLVANPHRLPLAIPAEAREVAVTEGAALPAARAALLAEVTTAWVLWTDVEHTYSGSQVGLWSALAGAREPSLGVVTNDPLGHDATPVVLHRRAAGTWLGRVRSRLTDAEGRTVGSQRLPSVALHAARLHPVDDDARRTRRAADLAAAREDVDDAIAATEAGTPPRPAALATTLEVLAGCQHDAGLLDDALVTATTMVEILPGTQETRHVLDQLARALLAAGRDAEVLPVVDALRAQRPADPTYCDWLAAQALAQLGRGAEAWQLCRYLTGTTDTHGRAVDAGLLHETRALIAVSAGQADAAVTDLAVAMAKHGHLAGRGPLLRELWGLAGRTGDPVDLLAELDPRQGEAFAAELAGVAA